LCCCIVSAWLSACIFPCGMQKLSLSRPFSLPLYASLRCVAVTSIRHPRLLLLMAPGWCVCFNVIVLVWLCDISICSCWHLHCNQWQVPWGHLDIHVFTWCRMGNHRQWTTKDSQSLVQDPSCSGAHPECEYMVWHEKQTHVTHYVYILKLSTTIFCWDPRELISIGNNRNKKVYENTTVFQL
jgi:hypothetical protein